MLPFEGVGHVVPLHQLVGIVEQQRNIGASLQISESQRFAATDDLRPHSASRDQSLVDWSDFSHDKDKTALTWILLSGERVNGWQQDGHHDQASGFDPFAGDEIVRDQFEAVRRPLDEDDLHRMVVFQEDVL